MTSDIIISIQQKSHVIDTKLDVSYAEDPTLISRLDELNGEVIGVTSSAKIAAAIASKEAIAGAVTAKGVEISEDVPLAEYAEKISKIPAPVLPVEGTPGNGFPVRFFDYDGTLLKTHYVHKGEDAIPPELPEHEYLSFQQWNNDYTNVQHPIDTGAMYKSSDGACYFFIRITQTDNRNFTLLHTVTNGTTVVDWGDGTSDTNEATFNTVHTYNQIGSYTIKLTVSEGAEVSINKDCIGSTAYKHYNSLLNVVLADSVTAITGSFNNCYKLKTVNIPAETYVTGGVFTNCYSLSGLVVLNTSTVDYINACYNLRFLGLPYSKSLYINQSTFASAHNLDMPIRPLGAGNFYMSLFCDKIVILNPTPVNYTMSTGVNAVKLYVPEGTLETYKNATNWSMNADIMEEFTEETILW